MRKILLFTLIAMTLVLSACGTAVQAASSSNQQPQQPAAQQADPGALRTISVYSTGQVSLSPDVAYIYIGVHSQSENVSDALTENNAKAQSVSAALQQLGIDPADIQTSGFNIYPQVQYSPTGEMLETTLYMVDNTVYVTVRDLQMLGQLLEVVVNNGANSINGITFDVLDKTQAIAEARRQAIENAGVQAQEIAQAAGVELGVLQTLTVGGVNSPTPLYEGRGGMGVVDASQVPIAAGQMILRVEVNAVYVIQ